jgi:hypothetical protein
MIKPKATNWHGEPLCQNMGVYSAGSFGSSQCGHRAKHDPDPVTGVPQKCGMHCEAAVERRRLAAEMRSRKSQKNLSLANERLRLYVAAEDIVRRLARDPEWVAQPRIARWIEDFDKYEKERDRHHGK